MRYSHPARALRVLELMVAAFHGDQVPALFLESRDNLPANQ